MTDLKRSEHDTISSAGGSRSQMLATLKTTFGYDTFRPLQESIVESMMAGRDVFVLMPTGGGKSLCYQLPALMQDGLTVVVSPLIALMKDQVDALAALGVPASFINSSLPLDEIRRRETEVRNSRVRLLYVAPERLMSRPFLDLLSEVKITRFAIDEAHCISEWGHDFRPEYRELQKLREIFPNVPLATFTATATSRVQADIVKQLKLENAASYRGSFNRENLIYDVRPKRSAYSQLVEYLRQRGRASGIIYCQSRDGTDRLAEDLRAAGFNAAAYHAGLESRERQRRQEAFSRDDIDIMVATIAFGMGVDKPDVRFVVHYDLPKNLEGYYQETGRAGRDGESSDCILFYSYGDAMKHRYFIDQIPGEAERKVATAQLQQMTDWASSTTCRRRSLLAYFDETLGDQPDPCCDICREPVELVDVTRPAQMFLSCVKRTGERFGLAYIIDVLLGSRQKRILEYRHDQLSTYGIGRDRSKDEWQHLSRELLRTGHIRQAADEYNAIKVTALGSSVLFDGAQVQVAAPPKSQRSTDTRDGDVAGYHGALFERLRALRKRLADERAVPPYVVFSDRALRQLAAHLPADSEGLLRVNGIGQRKADEFGKPFLQCIHEYVAETGAQPISSDGLRSATTRVERRPGSTVQETTQLFASGHSVAQIAEIRSLSEQTIEGHIEQAIAAGDQLDIARLVDDDKRRVIDAAMDEIGSDLLSPLREHLGDNYSYLELKVVRALKFRSTDVR